MKTAAILGNIVFFGFTCLVLTTDGLPKKAGWIALTLVFLIVPILSAATLSRRSLNPAMNIAGVIANAVLLALFFWVFAYEYPHPREQGYVAYVVLGVLVPMLSLAALLRVRKTAAG